MLRVALALTLAAPPAGAEPGAAPASEPVDTGAVGPSASGQGTLVFGPGATGGVRVVDPEGGVVATLTLRAEQRVSVDLPAARYRVETSTGELIDTVDLGAGQQVAVAVPEGMEREALPVVVPTAEAEPDLKPSVDTAPAPLAPVEVEEAEAAPDRRRRRGNWKRWGAPLFSALTPGVGQIVNREPGKGVGILLSTVTLGVAALSLAGSRDPTEGATPGDEGMTKTGEVLTLGAFSGVTGALFMLYAGQIMDAHAVARGRRKPEPRTKHKIHVDLTRMSTVGLRPGEPQYDHYPDWGISVMGQPVRRFSVGISDISLKWADERDRFTMQAGLRVSYRVFDRKRIWLALALGSLFQGSVMDAKLDPVDPDEGDPDREGEFGAVPYGQFEARIFVLDRWSLNLIPRISLPATTRYYRGNRALPKLATTFELGTGMGVYF